jgi:hypothetical protein
VSSRIEIRSRLEQRKVGLRLGQIRKPYRVLDADDGSVSDAPNEKLGQPVYARSVPMGLISMISPSMSSTRSSSVKMPASAMR